MKVGEVLGVIDDLAAGAGDGQKAAAATSTATGRPLRPRRGAAAKIATDHAVTSKGRYGQDALDPYGAERH